MYHPLHLECIAFQILRGRKFHNYDLRNRVAKQEWSKEPNNRRQTNPRPSASIFLRTYAHIFHSHAAVVGHSNYFGSWKTYESGMKRLDYAKNGGTGEVSNDGLGLKAFSHL